LVLEDTRPDKYDPRHRDCECDNYSVVVPARGCQSLGRWFESRQQLPAVTCDTAFVVNLIKGRDC